MNKKEVSEIKKQFTVKHAVVDAISMTYVTEEKDILFSKKEYLHQMPEEEAGQYLDLLKKGLTGKIGKNLYTMDFPTVDGGSKEENAFQQLRKMKEADLIRTIIDTYQTSSKYVILEAHGVYDVPGEEGYVYEFVEIALCPVQLSDDKLVCDANKKVICGRVRDMLLSPPTDAFLYPAFNDRCEDLHSVLYYTKKPSVKQDAMVECMIGKVRPLSTDEEMDVFHSSLEESGIGSMEIVGHLYDQIQEMQETTPDEVAPSCGLNMMEKMLRNCEVPEDNIVTFSQIIMNKIGENGRLRLEGLMDTKHYCIKNNYFDIKTDPELAGDVFVKEIDGQRYLLCPIKDSEVEINGITFQAH
ncbi:MAG: DUF4317 family protein [Blautia producta]